MSKVADNVTSANAAADPVVAEADAEAEPAAAAAADAASANAGPSSSSKSAGAKRGKGARGAAAGKRKPAGKAPVVDEGKAIKAISKPAARRIFDKIPQPVNKHGGYVKMRLARAACDAFQGSVSSVIKLIVQDAARGVKRSKRQTMYIADIRDAVYRIKPNSRVFPPT